LAIPRLEELEGRSLLSTFTVTTASDSGAGSLRQAILDANSTTGTNTISFAIGSGAQTIKPASVLPVITNPVVIDGTTQPGYSGTPIIVLDGTQAGSAANGLTITAGQSTVRGLAIDRFGGDGIALDIGGGNVIEGNYIGTDASGTNARANGGWGVDVLSGPGDTIGGTAPGTGNLIAGNNKGGIRVVGSSYFVSADNNVLRVDAQTGTTLTTLSTALPDDSVAIGADGSVYVADYYGNLVDHYDATGTLLGTFGSGQLSNPQDLVFGPDGNLYVGNVGGGVQKFSASGAFLGAFIANGSGGLNNGTGITWGPDGNAYIANLTDNSVLRYDGITGAFLGAFVASGSGGLNSPKDLQFGPDGNLYVTSYGTDSVIRYSGSTGACLGTFATTPANTYGLRFDTAGNLAVTCRNSGHIRVYSGTTGAFLRNLATGLANPAWFTGVPATSGGDLIAGNVIGSSTGSGGLANGGPGVFVDASNVTIGGTTAGAANTIAHNSGTGVAIPAGSGIAVLGNAIYGDANPGIDLGNDGVTANTGSEDSALPNDGMNYPVITLAALNGNTLTVAGYVGSAPGQAPFAGARVELFSASSGTGNNGQGQTYLGYLTTDANGVFNGLLTVSGLSSGNPVTATATDTARNTSEFAANVALATGPVIDLDAEGYGNSYSTSYQANTAPVPVENIHNATITDPASATLVSLTVTLQNTQDGAQEVLRANTAGTHILGMFSGNTLTLSGTDTLANYQQVLRSITYQDQALTPQTNNVRRVVFTANDGTHTGASVKTSVTVTPTSLLASGTNIASSQTPSVYGQTVTFTASVVGAPPAVGVPTGTVAFMDGSSILGTATLTGGTAIYTTAALSVGSHAISAHYGGDVVFLASTSSALTQSINSAVLTVTADNLGKDYGQLNPALTDTITGFVNGDSAAVVSGSAVLTTTATTGSAVASYTITAAQGTLSAANYTFAMAGGTLTITPALLTVSANNTGKVYGQANPAFSATITGFVNGDTAAVVSGSASLTTSATSSSGVGSYLITAAQGTLSAANYTFAFVGGTLTVSPALLTITANDTSKVYGQANPALTGTISGFVNGDATSVVSGSASLTTSATTSSGVGRYPILLAQGTLRAANYTFACISGALTISPAVLSVTANDASKVYGDANPALGDTITGYVNGDNTSIVSGSASLATAATTGSGVGTYPIIASQGSLTAANYTFSCVNGTLTVTPASLTVAASDASRSYGQANPTFTDMITGFVNGDDVSVVTGSADLSTSATPTSAVGTYAIAAAQHDLQAANYTFTFAGGTLAVSPTPLTVTANSTSKVAGQPNPTFTAAYSGFVNGEAPGVLGGSLTFSTPATTTSPVGNYPITPTGLTSANYAITFVDGNLQVTTAPLSASRTTVVSSGSPSVYGQTVTFKAMVSAVAPATGTPTGTVTFVDGANDLATVPLSGGIAVFATATLSATSHSITVRYSGDSTFASSTSAVLPQTVAPAPLTVTANDASKVYGQANPAFSVRYQGFVNGDGPGSLSGTLSFRTAATTSSPVGAYTVTPDGLTGGNYAITFAGGTLRITPARLTVMANDALRTYGQPNPNFRAAIIGFVNGDNAAVVSGNATLTTIATASSGIGSYPIVAVQGTLSAANYAFAFVNGTLAVNPALLTVTASHATKVYGQPNPAFGDTIAGFVNGESAAVVGGRASLTTSATVSSSVGGYPIVAAKGTLSAANYTFRFFNGTLTVTPALLTISADDTSKVYGQANPAFTATTTGFVNGDSTAVVRGRANLTTTATVRSGVGTYTISAARGSLGAANYTFTFVNGTLAVTPALLTVTANDASRDYGDANPTFAAAITGFVNGDTAAVVSGSPALSSPATTDSAAGTYPIIAVQGTLGAANYCFTFVGGTLTVSPPVQPVTSSPRTPPPPPPTSLPTTANAPTVPPSAATAVVASATPSAAAASSGAAATGNASAAPAAVVAAVAHSAGSHAVVAVDAPVVPVAPPAPAPSVPPPAPAASIPPPSPQVQAAATAPALAPQTASMSSAVVQPVLDTTALYEELDEFQPQIEHRPAGSLLQVGVITGLVASAGYLLLSARASYWLLTLLLARPLMWKRLDPIEVLFAWEKEKQRRARQAEDESLQSLVGAKREVPS
jgi:hypothetical protein